MIANKIGEEFYRGSLAGIGRNLMGTVGCLVETLARMVDVFILTLHLRAQHAVNNVADDWARVTMGRGRFASPVCNLNDGDLKMAAIQGW